MHTHTGTFDSMSSGDGSGDIEQAPPYSETAVSATANLAVAAPDAQQSRMSAYSFADLPEVVPGTTYSAPEVVPSSTYGAYPEAVKREDGKEAIHNPYNPESDKQALPNDRNDGKEIVPPEIEPRASGTPGATQRRLDRKVLGVRVKWGLLILIILVVLIIALGAGLGAGLHKSSPSVSTSGVYNQSRIALAYQRQDQNNDTTLVMYFQHQNGHMRSMERANDGIWVGGGTQDDFISNPAAVSPVSVVSYQWQFVDWWRVYFIDSNFVVQELWNGSATATWASGLLTNPASVINGPVPKAYNGQKVGMTACWDGPNAWNESTLPWIYDPNDIVIRLIYAINETSFQELSYNHGTLLWTVLGTFNNLNTAVSPACFNARPGADDYMMFTDPNNNLVVYWKDNSTATSNRTARWTKTSISIPNVADASELAYTNGTVFAQSSADSMIHGYQIDFDGNSTSFDTSKEFVVQGPPAVSGTGLAAIPETDGDDEYVIVVYQPEGTTGLREFRQSLNTNVWTMIDVDIPNT